jgi:hypothetical protein
MKLTLYRAMNKEETMRSRSGFAWRSKHKWFSQDRGWIESRVMDGRFNNSQHKPGRYACLLRFDVSVTEDLKDTFDMIGNKELMLNIRKANRVKILSTQELNAR